MTVRDSRGREINITGYQHYVWCHDEIGTGDCVTHWSHSKDSVLRFAAGHLPEAVDKHAEALHCDT